MATYLHERADFGDLLKAIESETGILVQLIEKDYWIMHVLYGLKKQGFEFELKGGTSLSKAFHIIDRFSEDIDIHIKPAPQHGINENPKNNKPKNVEAKKKFYDWLAQEINIDGIVHVQRDEAFDAPHTYNSGGIRLLYKSVFESRDGMKEGILLEVGFDKITPNSPMLISSWAFDKASQVLKNQIKDNRARNISCYHPGYTFVEKLQTIATKFRREQETKIERPNLMRQYYDVYRLLHNKEVLDFIGSKEYHQHKLDRFPKVDFEIPLSRNEAFLLKDPLLRKHFSQRYSRTAALYYNGQPDFYEIIELIQRHLKKL